MLGGARAETSVITFTPGSQGSSWGESVRRQDDKAGISEGRLLGLGFEVSPRRSELPASCWAFPHAHMVSLPGTQGLEGFAPSLETICFPTRESVHPFSQSHGHLCCEPPLDEVLPCRGPDADFHSRLLFADRSPTSPPLSVCAGPSVSPCLSHLSLSFRLQCVLAQGLGLVGVCLNCGLHSSGRSQRPGRLEKDGTRLRGPSLRPGVEAGVGPRQGQ